MRARAESRIGHLNRRNRMGIQDRDYMRRQPDGDGQQASSPDEKLDALLGNFLRRHRRLPLAVGIALALLLVVAVLLSKLSANSH